MPKELLNKKKEKQPFFCRLAVFASWSNWKLLCFSFGCKWWHFSMGSKCGLDFMLTLGCFSNVIPSRKHTDLAVSSIQTWNRYTAMISYMYIEYFLSDLPSECYKWFSLGVLPDGGQGLLLLCSFWLSLSFWTMDLFVNLTLGPYVGSPSQS